MTERQIAVLIDFENVGLDSIQWLFDQISDVGRIIVKRAYTDWSKATAKRRVTSAAPISHAMCRCNMVGSSPNRSYRPGMMAVA